MNEIEGCNNSFKNTPKIAALWGSVLIAVFPIAVFLLLISPVKKANAELLQSASNRNLSAITASGNLTITKTHSGVFTVGSTGVYTIRIKNVGTDTVTGTVAITDTLPTGLTLNNLSGSGWNPCTSGQIFTCIYSNTLGITPTNTLPPLLLTVNVANPGVMVVINTVTLANSNEITTTDNTAFDPTQIANADLQVEKTPNPTNVRAGGIVDFTIRVTNNGPNNATNVVVTDTLPTDFNFISYTVPTGMSYNPTSGRWTVGTLNATGNALLIIRGRVRSNFSGSQIQNITQGASSSLPDFKKSNNIYTATVTTESSADFVLTKDSYCDYIAPSDTVSYTIHITNTGYLDTGQVTITDSVHSLLTYLSDTLIGQSGVTAVTPASSSSRTRVWRINNITGAQTSQGSYTFILRATAPSSLSTGVVVSNYITGTITGQEGNQDNNRDYATATTIGAPNLLISESVSPSETRVNQNFTFSIKATNNGTQQMTNVVIQSPFSSYLNISTASTTLGTALINYTSRTVTANLGALNPGQSATITIVVTVNSSATTTVTLSNQSTATFRYGCYSRTASSNSLNFRIIGASSTLPGTGYSHNSISRERDNQLTGGFWAALISALLIGIAGLFVFGYGILARKGNPEWSGWSLRMGLILSGLAVLFGLAAWGMSNPGSFNLWETVGEQTTEVAVLPESPATPTNLVLVNSPYGFQNHETLPDYPIPTPTIPPSMTDEPADTTPPVRILIPELDLDTEVKYVPFDGYSWLIQGLQWEVAWMGDTSWPGLGGNTSIAGHVTLRNGSNGPFRFIENLGQGSEIVLQTEKNLYHYKVIEKKVVESSDLSVISPTEVSTLTLITCTDWDTNLKVYLKRLIVSAELEEVVPLAANVGG